MAQGALLDSGSLFNGGGNILMDAYKEFLEKKKIIKHENQLIQIDNEIERLTKKRKLLQYNP